MEDQGRRAASARELGGHAPGFGAAFVGEGPQGVRGHPGGGGLRGVPVAHQVKFFHGDENTKLEEVVEGRPELFQGALEERAAAPIGEGDLFRALHAALEAGAKLGGEALIEGLQVGF